MLPPPPPPPPPPPLPPPLPLPVPPPADGVDWWVLVEWWVVEWDDEQPATSAAISARLPISGLLSLLDMRELLLEARSEPVAWRRSTSDRSTDNARLWFGVRQITWRSSLLRVPLPCRAPLPPATGAMPL